MKTTKHFLSVLLKKHGLGVLILFCLLFTFQAQAQLTVEQQAKVDNAIANATGQVPGFKQFVDLLNQGTTTVETDNPFKFKFIRKVEHIPFGDVITSIGGLVTDPTILNHPVISGFKKIFNDNSITAEITVADPNSPMPVYSISLLGAALQFEFELFFKHGTGVSDFVLALSPSNSNFNEFDPSLAVLDSLGKPGVAIILSTNSLTPEMAILRRLKLEGHAVDAGLTALVNVAVNEESEFGRIFQVKNLVAQAQIFNPPSAIKLSASIKPDWPLGNDARILDGTVYFQIAVGESGPELSIGSSISLQTDLPSSADGLIKSTVDWTVNGEVGGSLADKGGVNIRFGAFGRMDGIWKTPFGQPGLDLYSGGLEFGLNVTVVPGKPPKVTILPDMGIRGKLGIGKDTTSIIVEYAGKLDFSSPQNCGLAFNLENIGLGTVTDALMYNQIGRSMAAHEIEALNNIVLDQGKLSLFVKEGWIAGQKYLPGFIIKGGARVFGVGGSVELLLKAEGLTGEINILPLVAKSGDLEIFSFTGYNKNDPMRGMINVKWNSLLAQLTDSFNGTPFLVFDAQLGFMGTSSKTKLVLNPIQGSYFSTNTKLWNLLDVKLDGEAASLSNFGALSIRGAFDKAPAEEINKAIIQAFDNTLRGLVPKEKIAELDAAIASKDKEIENMTAQVQSERNKNITQYNKAKKDLQTLDNQYNTLASLAMAKWKEHEATVWWDFNRRSQLWGETTALNIQKDGLSVGIHTAQITLDGLIWVNNLPPVEADPRISSLYLQRQGLQEEKNWLNNINNLGNTVSGVMKSLHGYFMANGIGEIVDVKQVEFAGKLSLLEGGYFDAMINLKLMGKDYTLKSKIGTHADGTFDVLAIINDILNNRMTPGFSPSFAAEIGTKYNYSSTVATVAQITPPSNAAYVPPLPVPTTTVGSAGNTAGLDNHAITFSGVNSFQEETINWEAGLSEMTIEAWVKSEGSTGGFQTIVSGNDGLVHFQMHPNGEGNNAVYLSNGIVILLPILPDVSTKWRHVAIVLKSGDSKVYQNGEVIGLPNYLGFGNGTLTPTKKIRLGGNIGYGGRHLKGKLADVRIWKKARTQAEIKASIHDSLPVGTPGLVAVFGQKGNSPAASSIPHLDQRAQSINPQTNISTPGNITQNLSAMTIEAWVRNDGGGENIQAIVSSANLDFTHLQASDDANVKCAVYVNNGEVYLPSIPKNPGNWQHVAMVIQSGNSQLYINGAPYGAKDTKTFGSIKPAANVLIGKGFGNSRPFNGKIANVRIWNRAIPQGELSIILNDFSLNDGPGLLYHSPTINAISIASANDCVAVPAAATSGLQSLTIEAWVNNSSPQTDIQAIVSATGPEFVHLQLSADGNVKNAVYLDDGRSIMLPVVPKIAAGWHHVAMVIESGNSRIYLNGQQIGAADTTTFSGIKPSSSVFIGKGWSGGRVFSGRIADVRIWKNRPLTQAQLSTYQFTPPPPDAMGLAYHYK